MASPVALFLLFGYFPEIVQHVSSNLKKVAWYNCTFPLEALTQEQSRSADGRGGGGKFAENHQTDWSGGDLRRRGAGPKKGNRKDWGQDRPNFCQAAEPSTACDLFLTRSILSRFFCFLFCLLGSILRKKRPFSYKTQPNLTWGVSGKC